MNQKLYWQLEKLSSGILAGKLELTLTQDGRSHMKSFFAEFDLGKEHLVLKDEAEGVTIFDVKGRLPLDTPVPELAIWADELLGKLIESCKRRYARTSIGLVFGGVDGQTVDSEGRQRFLWELAK